MSRVVLIEARPRDATATTQVVRLAGGGTRPYAWLGHDDWRAGVAQEPKFTAVLGFDQTGWTGGAIAQIGAIAFSPAAPGLADSLAQLMWLDAPITVWAGDDATGVFATRLAGTVVGADSDGGKLTLTASDLSAALAMPSVDARFAGSGGIEGGTDAAGRLKRRNWGRVFDVECRLLETAYNIFEVGDPAQPLADIVAVRDRGVAGALQTIAWAGSVAATYAALKAGVPPAGGGLVAPSIACVRWYTDPAGPLCADLLGEVGAGYVETAPAIAQRLVATASTMAVDLSAAARPAAAGLHLDSDGETVGQALDRLLLPVSLLWALDPAGTLRMRPWRFDAPVATIASTRVARRATYRPLRQRILGYQRNQRVHSDGEIASSLDDAAKGALAVASQASRDAAAAAADIAIIGSDGYLSRGEKPRVVRDWTAIDAETPTLRAQAQSLGVSATAYQSAHDALAFYLGSLSPAWYDARYDTAISAATFSGRFTDYYFAKIGLLTAIDAAASKTATWDGVYGTGKDALIAEAASAAADASAALTQLGVIASDGYLSRGEKSTIIQDWAAIFAEKTPLDAQADQLGVSRAAYDGAWQALSDYLGSLSPAWNDVSDDTAINAAQFNGRFTDYYFARTLLLNAMAQAAANAGPASNQVVLSNFARGLAGFQPGFATTTETATAAQGVAVTVDQGLNLSADYSGIRQVAFAHARSITLAAGDFLDVFATIGFWNVTGSNGVHPANPLPYMMPVKLGETLYARSLLAQHRCTAKLYLLIFDTSGGLIQAPRLGGARESGGLHGDPANFDVVGGTFVPTDPRCAYACLMWQMVGNGGDDPYLLFTEPAMGKLSAGQQLLPPYVDGPTTPLADQTSQNVALDTTMVAGVPAATVNANIEAAGSLAGQANGTAQIGAQLAADVADNGKFSSTEKKRWVEKIQALEAAAASEIAQGHALGLDTQAGNLQAAFDQLTAMLNAYRYTDVAHSTSIDRNYFKSVVAQFDASAAALATAAQAYAASLSQKASVNIFLDPLFQRPTDTTAWTGWDGRAVPEDSGDGRRLRWPPDQSGDMNQYAYPVVLGPFDRVDVEFEYYVGSGVTSSSLFGVNLDGRDGSGNGYGVAGVLLNTAAVPRDRWLTYKGSVYGSQFGGNLAVVLPHALCQPLSGDSVYFRRPQGYRVVGSAANLDPYGRQRSALLTTAYAVNGSISIQGLTTTASSSSITLSDFTVDFGDGYTAISGTTLTGLAANALYYIWVLAPNQSNSGRSFAVNRIFNGNTDRNRVYLGAVYTQTSSGGPGGGGSTREPPCVVEEMLLVDGVFARDARRGTAVEVLLADWSGAELAEVCGNARWLTECVEITTHLGAVVECSTSTPIELPDGRTILAPYAMGVPIAVVIDERFLLDKVAAVRPIGVRWVARISVGGRIFAAGREARARVFTHNVYKP